MPCAPTFRMCFTRRRAHARGAKTSSSLYIAGSPALCVFLDFCSTGRVCKGSNYAVRSAPTEPPLDRLIVRKPPFRSPAKSCRFGAAGGRRLKSIPDFLGAGAKCQFLTARRCGAPAPGRSRRSRDATSYCRRGWSA